MKSIGKPCAVAPYARFDEKGLVRSTMEWLLRHRQTKEAETDRLILMMIGANSLLYPGDPESPLLWTCKSTRQLAETLCDRGYKIGRQKVSELLSELGYSLQSNRKTKDGSSHPDRDKQFRYLNRRIGLFQNHCQPVISVDTKKKELIGNFSNNGKEWCPKGEPIKTDSHDFGKD